MKITLDHKALERLLGNDTELEVELRNCVVQEFAEKHLKAIANSETFKLLEARIIKGVQQEVDKQIGTFSGYPTKVSLNKKIEEEIRNQVSREFFKLFNERITEIREEAFRRLEYSKEQLEVMIDSKIDKDIQLIVDKKVGDKLNYIITQAGK